MQQIYAYNVSVINNAMWPCRYENMKLTLKSIKTYKYIKSVGPNTTFAMKLPLPLVMLSKWDNEVTLVTT